METVLIKFKDPKAVYEVEEQFVEFIKLIKDVRVREIFACTLGKLRGDGESSLYNLTCSLTSRRRDILLRKYSELTKLPEAVVKLMGSYEMVGGTFQGGRVLGYGDYTVGVGFVEYMQANLERSIFKDYFRVYLDETVIPSSPRIEVNKPYAGLLDLTGYLCD